jgi:glucose-1-phosphate cytidylyltransferase
VDIGDDGRVTHVTPMRDLLQWENGGYFVLRPEIFDHLNEGEDLVEDAITQRLVPLRRVLAYPYKGYLSPADTVKERAQLEDMYQRGYCPWMIWNPDRSGMVEPLGSALDDTARAPAHSDATPLSIPALG